MSTPISREEWVAQRAADREAQIIALNDGCRFCSNAIESSHSVSKTGELLVIGATVTKVDGVGYVAFHSKCIEERTKTTREERTCEGCGYKRVVKVKHHFDYRTAYIDEHFARKCSACEAMGRARYYAQQANAFHAKALKLYKKQGTSWRQS